MPVVTRLLTAAKLLASPTDATIPINSFEVGLLKFQAKGKPMDEGW